VEREDLQATAVGDDALPTIDHAGDGTDTACAMEIAPPTVPVSTLATGLTSRSMEAASHPIRAAKADA
jgi:hypothetical protein